MIYVKQYGLKRSGTCYTTALLRQNWPDEVHVLIHKLGGKHADPIVYQTYETDDAALKEAILSDRIRALIVSKHPYSWAWSYIRTHSRWPGDFKKAWREDRHAAIASACKTWNTRNRLWRSSRQPHYVTWVRHEDLLENFHRTMSRIQSQLDLPFRPGFENITNQMTPRDTVGRRPFKAQRYKNRHFIWRLGREWLNVVDKNIDWDFAAQLGYSRLNLKELW